MKKRRIKTVRTDFEVELLDYLGVPYISPEKYEELYKKFLADRKCYDAREWIVKNISRS